MARPNFFNENFNCKSEFDFIEDAITYYEVVERFDNHTFIQVWIDGRYRKHQIRAHLAHIGIIESYREREKKNNQMSLRIYAAQCFTNFQSAVYHYC